MILRLCWFRFHTYVTATLGASIVTVLQSCAVTGEDWGHTTVSTVPSAPIPPVIDVYEDSPQGKSYSYIDTVWARYCKTETFGPDRAKAVVAHSAKMLGADAVIDFHCLVHVPLEGTDETKVLDALTCLEYRCSGRAVKAN